MSNNLQIKGLVNGVPNRDPETAASIFERCAPELRGMLRRILPSNDEAEEALQSIFIDLWKGGEGQGKTALRLESWILLTARTEAVRRFRRAGGLADLKFPGSDGLASIPCAGVAEMSLLKSRRNLLHRSLAQLPATQRRLLDLVLLKGETEEEIAAADGEPLGKVRDQVRAALAFTRQRLNTLMGTWTAGI